MNQKINSPRYYKFSKYLQEKYKKKVYKITLDAGFLCPNRDGTISTSGCIFCDDTGSFSMDYSKQNSVSKQVECAILKIPKRYKAKAFIAYFQAFSNTYAPVEKLKKVYDEAFVDDRIVGISIGTRPDCVDEEKIKLISTYKDPWIEYGLQSSNNKTLELINRGHNFECFADAVKLTKKYGIKVCAHVILGLMGENREDMLKTAQELVKLGVDGVKFHCLTILKNTKLYEMHKIKPVKLLTEDEYCNILCDILEILPPNVVIQRTAGTGLLRGHVAPDWIKNRFITQNKIDEILEKRNSYQGLKCSNMSSAAIAALDQQF